MQVCNLEPRDRMTRLGSGMQVGAPQMRAAVRLQLGDGESYGVFGKLNKGGGAGHSSGGCPLTQSRGGSCFTPVPWDHVRTRKKKKQDRRYGMFFFFFVFWVF